MTDLCLLAHIQGRVQGVGFRYHTQNQAQQLGLGGWVRNMPDGSVQACICGKPGQIKAMQQWLKQGPPYAGVSHIDYTPTEPDQSWRNFSIR